MHDNKSITPEDLIRGFKTCDFRFDDINQAQSAMQEVAHITKTKEVELSHITQSSTAEIRGIVLLCQFCCEVFTKLDERNRPYCREALLSLQQEYASAIALEKMKLKRCPHQSECPESLRIDWGIREIVRRVRDW